MEIKNGYLTDLHVHSSFSYDCEETTENYIIKAIERGDERIGFVQHYDYDCFIIGDKTPLCDLDAYKNEIDRLKNVYGEKIKISAATTAPKTVMPNSWININSTTL